MAEENDKKDKVDTKSEAKNGEVQKFNIWPWTVVQKSRRIRKNKHDIGNEITYETIIDKKKVTKGDMSSKGSKYVVHSEDMIEDMEDWEHDKQPASNPKIPSHEEEGVQ